jgi:hypothetical protein
MHQLMSVGCTERARSDIVRIVLPNGRAGC